ncbi:RHG27 protein, partial [Amia calva]|nr:RHG27 protein [Amia calva]
MAAPSKKELVLVEFEYEYTGRDGGQVCIKPNERYILLSKTNDHWWHVRKDEHTKPFYIPAKYVKELPSVLPSPLDFIEPNGLFPAAEPEKKTLDMLPVKREEVTISPRATANYRKNEYRMSTFGTPQDLHHDQGFLGMGFTESTESLITLKPLPEEAKDVSTRDARLLHLKRYSLGPNVINSLCSWGKQCWISLCFIVHSSSLSCFPLLAQVESENPSSAVYVNVAELKKGRAEPDTTPAPPPARRTLSTSSVDWEVHVDKDSGQEFFYNTLTGQTTWEIPTLPAPFELGSDWEQHLDEASGRYYFYNSVTGDTSWEPPELHSPSETDMEPENNNRDHGPPPLPEEDYPSEVEASPVMLQKDFSYAPIKKAIMPRVNIDSEAPAGWSSSVDSEGNTLFTCDHSQEQWIQSVDEHGQTYYYTADGSKSQWNLPELPVAFGQPKVGNGFDMAGVPVIKNWRHTMVPSQFGLGQEDAKFFPSHRRNVSDFGSDISSSPELQHQTHTLEKAGILNKTKVLENGKRLRKNWAQSWTVLHGGILTFYKDPKSQQATASKTNQIVPEYTVELRGASIAKAMKDKSSKKNVLELKTRHGSEYLVQYDTESIITDWFKVINDTIRQLDREHHSEGEESEGGGSEKSPGPGDKEDKKRACIMHLYPSELLCGWFVTSVWILFPYSATRQSVSGSSTSEADQKKVRTKLRKFLQRRPTLQSVKEKGYIRDQVFGCYLQTLCEREGTTVPSFVEKCIQAVEKRGLDIDGLYRVSGNLAVIQKLRFKVDHEENLDLEDGQWEDIHVITGALKLFFRELPEPLFPYNVFNNFIAGIKISDYNQKVTYMRDLVRSLPPPNHDTMKLLFSHLRRVIDYGEENRMSVQSVAIVFGPTLLKPETESANITMHMVFQNQIVEHILNEYERIFGRG